MSGHTPGPWRVVLYDCGDISHRDHNGPCPGVFAAPEHDCAIVHWDGFKQEFWSSANGDQRQIEANAALISAAPDMLEALEAAVADLEQTLRWRGEGWECSEDKLLGKARAAIAKARGES